MTETNPLAPSPSLLAKLGSIIVHADEGSGPTGHSFDWEAFRALLNDYEVQEWLIAMEAMVMIPVKR